MNNVDEWLESIKLARKSENIYIGNSEDVGSSAVFGGQVLSQAVDAAQKTVDEKRVIHSLHSYFILPGNLKKEITYDVQNLRDGGSFSTRRVTAFQDERAIFISASSFQRKEEGYEHQIEMPDVKKPEKLFSDHSILNKLKYVLPAALQKDNRPRPIEFRPINLFSYVAPINQKPFSYVWIKAKGRVPKDQKIQKRLLAYASDYNLLITAIRPHQSKTNLGKLQMASLDHAMWFFHEVDLNDWILYAIDSPSAGNARGFTRGNFFTRDGKLIASTTQEGLMRKRRKR